VSLTGARALRFILLGVSCGWLGAASVSFGQILGYEWVTQSGPNNVVDSNAASCDSNDGCFTSRGGKCSAQPNQMCDLQIVPAGRCTYGDAATNSVWPHGAGHCVGIFGQVSTKVGHAVAVLNQNTAPPGGNINSADLARFRVLNGSAASDPTQKCPTCPLQCSAGTAGFCP